MGYKNMKVLFSNYGYDGKIKLKKIFGNLKKT